MDETPPDSPCIKVCVVDQVTGHCIGCGRSRDEIAGWLHFSDGEKSALVAELPGRLADMTAKRKRRGGRGSRRSEKD